MRIIAGELKGKKILLPKDKKTRPLRDMVRESIFNLIEHSNKLNCVLKKSKVLDLFSGTGSFGLECISRKAKKVTFIEYHKDALKILMENIRNLDVKDKTNIIEIDVFNFFNLEKNFKEKFDFIFIDPPYKEEKIDLIIDNIKKKNILNKNGILIIHRHIKDRIDLNKSLNIIDQRNYGISKIILGN